MPNQPEKPSLNWGAFKADGTLEAILSSKSEAYFYIQNRGHMYGGSFHEIESPESLSGQLAAAKALLCYALPEIADVATEYADGDDPDMAARMADLANQMRGLLGYPLEPTPKP
jgi:hypothetical protein